MKKEMLINALQPEESRIAITENGVLEELYVERNSLESCVDLQGAGGQYRAVDPGRLCRFRYWSQRIPARQRC